MVSERPTPDPSRLSVLFVSHSGHYGGGAEYSFKESLSAFRAAGHPVVAVFPAQGPLVEDAAALGAGVHTATLPWWVDWHRRVGFRPHAGWAVRHVVAVSEALRLLRRQRPSLVVTNTLTPPSFAIAARLARLPHVWIVREFGDLDYDLYFPLGYRRTLGLIASLSRTVVCCSKAVEARVVEFAPAARTRVVYPGIESPLLPFRPRRSGPLRVVLVGRFSETKGQRVAVEALAVARQVGADVELTLVGPGDTDDVAQLARRLGVEHHVQLRPSTTEPIEVWREAHVALMCSRAEAFGRVTVEAMRASLPVCGADSGGTREIVADEVNGLLFPPGDSVSLASKLVRLATDETFRQALASGAAQTGSTYTVARFSGDLLTSILS